MPGWSIESHDEVTDWLVDLDDDEWLVAEGHVDLLGEYGNTLRMPHSGALGDGLFELRFTMGHRAWRITYWFAPGGVIVLLTVFRKQRQVEAQEVARARAAIKECQQDHLGERRRSQLTHTPFEEIAGHRREKMDDAARADYDSKKAALVVALRAGIAIRDARENAGLTQTDLAARMGISQPALARIEAGRTNVTLATLAKVAAGLGTMLVLGVGDGTVTLVPARPSGRSTARTRPPRASGARPEKSGAPRSSKARPEGEQVSSHAS